MDNFQNVMVKKLVNHIEMTLGDKNKVEVTMIAAAGVIYKIGENGEMMVLLIQRAADDHWPLHWEFPRGKCDKPVGERVDKCALREIKEECGLDVEVEKFLDKFQYLADEGKRRTICYNFLCKMKNPDQEIKLSKEHENYMWVTNLGQVDLMVMPEQRKTLEMVLSKDNPIVSTPKNSFTQNNNIEEFLKRVQSNLNEAPQRKQFLMPNNHGCILTARSRKGWIYDFMIFRHKNEYYRMDIDEYDGKRTFKLVDDYMMHDAWDKYSANTKGGALYVFKLHVLMEAYGPGVEDEKLVDDTLDKMILQRKPIKNFNYAGDVFINLISYFTIRDFKLYKNPIERKKDEIYVMLDVIIGNHITRPIVNFKQIRVENHIFEPKHNLITTYFYLI